MIVVNYCYRFGLRSNIGRALAVFLQHVRRWSRIDAPFGTSFSSGTAKYFITFLVNSKPNGAKSKTKSYGDDESDIE